MDLNPTTQDIHLSHYWNVILKRWKVALSILVVVMLGTFIASYFSKPIFRSTTTIQIERENPNQVTIEDLFGIEASDQEFLQTQYSLLKSRGLSSRVVDDQKLLSDPEFYPAGISNKTPQEIALIRESMSGVVLAGMDVAPVHGTSLVDIGYVATSPRLAQKIANGIVDSYMRMTTEQKFQRVRDATEFLQAQIIQVKNDIDRTRLQQQKYSEQNGIISVGGANTITEQTLIKLNGDASAADNDRIAKQTQYDSILRSTPESVTGNDSLVRSLGDEEARLQRDYNQSLAIFKPDHPKMQALKQQIDKTHQAKLTAASEAYAKARDVAHNELLAAEARVSEQRAALDRQKRETLGLNVSAAGYVDISTSIQTKQALLEQLEKRQNETEVTARLRGSNSSNIHWIDKADLPQGRFNLTMKRNLQSAFPLGILLGFGAIFFLEYMDRSIKTSEELERVTRFAPLGIIPSAATMGRGYGIYGSTRGSGALRAVETAGEPDRGIDLLPHFDSRSPISEAYRAFRTSLLLASANSPKIIVITSTFAREGKTTTSVNLATVLAQMGKPVLLIDADLRRPRLQKVFRNKLNVGLVNYLAAGAPLEDVTQDTIVPNLSVILSGPTPPNPSELLASDRLKQLIHELRSRYAFVIFDSPPVLAVTDSIVLAASADGVVLCVHGGQTPRELVQRSSERLRQSNIPVLGTLLNNLDLQQYGYAFKKSYYDYYGDDPKKEPDVPVPARRSN